MSATADTPQSTHASTSSLAPAPPTSSKLSYSAIARYAERIAEQHDAIDPETGHVDVHRLLEKLGGRLEIDDGTDSLIIRGPHDFTVHVPTHTSRLRDRFAIAHELGHYFLHFRAPDHLRVGAALSSASRTGGGIADIQANVFASNLLMPATRFQAAFAAHDGDLARLACLFEVSRPATLVRAGYLGLDGCPAGSPERHPATVTGSDDVPNDAATTEFAVIDVDDT